MRRDCDVVKTTSIWKAFVCSAIVCVTIPGLPNVKAVVLIALATYLILTTRTRPWSAVWFLSVLLHLVIWSEVALLHGVSSSDTANQATRTLLFFVILGIGAYIQRSTGIRQSHLDKLIAWIAVLSALLKGAALGLVLLGWFTLDAVERTLGFETVTDNIGFGLQRLQFPSDIIIIFLLFSYVGGRRKLLDALVLTAISFSVVISFSRYLFVGYAVALLLRIIFLRKLDFMSRLSFFLGVVVLTVFSVSILSRFVGEGAVGSDTIRSEQIQKLAGSIRREPIIGQGLGASVHGYKRSYTLPFSYEVQWYAITMQLGVLGLLWFLLNLVAVLVAKLKTPRHSLCFAAMFTLWLTAGFTNPFIISLGSAFGLSLLTLRFAIAVEGQGPCPATDARDSRLELLLRGA